MIKKIFEYGNKVEGYEKPVLNEREARAAAGILLVIGLLSLTNAVMLGNGIVTRYFISFFTFDFLMRVINPNYSPSLLVGRFFVRNQQPEYVGALQKRFAWGIGLLLSLPMFYFLVINWQPNPIKIVVCVICLSLLMFESAFSICLGCKIYNMIMPTPATNCPGGSCEIKTRDKITTFNPVQKIIAIITLLLFLYGSYFYMFKIDNKTHFGKMLSEKIMSKEELKILEEKRLQEEFDNEDF